MPTPFSNGILLGGVSILSGTGTPEGVVTANVGSRFFSANGKEYVKASGTGNTGWVEVTAVAQEVALSWTGDGAATYRAAVACVLSSPGFVGGGTPTLDYQYKPSGGTYAAATFPLTMAASGVLKVTLTGFNTEAAWSCIRA